MICPECGSIMHTEVGSNIDFIRCENPHCNNTIVYPHSESKPISLEPDLLFSYIKDFMFKKRMKQNRVKLISSKFMKFIS